MDTPADHEPSAALSGSGALEDDLVQLSAAKNAAMLGVIGLFALSTACCTSIIGLAGGTLMGVVGAFTAWQQHHDELGPATRAYTNVGLYAGGAAASVGLLYTLAVVAYLLLYAVIIIITIIGASL